jgi:hypothetical protein
MRRLFVVLAVVTLGASGLAAEVVDRVLAVVGPRVITLSDARAAVTFGLVEPPAGADAVAEGVAYLVNRQLMLSEVDRYGVPPPGPDTVSIRVTRVKERFPGPGQLARAMEATAMTEARLRDLVSDTLRIESYLDQRFNAQAQPTADEVERYYRDHLSEFTRDGKPRPFEEIREQVHVRVVDDRRTALIADWLDRLRRRAIVTLR